MRLVGFMHEEAIVQYRHLFFGPHARWGSLAIVAGMALGWGGSGVEGAPLNTATVAVGSAPQAIAVDSASNRLYVTNCCSGTVSVIDGATHRVIATVPVGDLPTGIGVDPATHQ